MPILVGIGSGVFGCEGRTSVFSIDFQRRRASVWSTNTQIQHRARKH